MNANWNSVVRRLNGEETAVMLALTGSKCAWEWGIFMGQSPMEYGRKVFQCHTSIRQDMDLHPNKKRTRSVSLVHLFSLIKNSVLRAVKLNHIPLRWEREQERTRYTTYHIMDMAHGRRLLCWARHDARHAFAATVVLLPVHVQGRPVSVIPYAVCCTSSEERKVGARVPPFFYIWRYLVEH